MTRSVAAARALWAAVVVMAISWPLVLRWRVRADYGDAVVAWGPAYYTPPLLLGLVAAFMIWRLRRAERPGASVAAGFLVGLGAATFLIWIAIVGFGEPEGWFSYTGLDGE